ncbi:hypothetical protein [Bradyrhizobium sp. ARR65]|uniref:hypothetical protein n=1 Tax=Bradyrhizobium sp. ARR65 TaxID=1040989 RepID=UPI000AF5ED73|nr:hypothetical protein [Bradyrhizobium sp. ARR65]
MRGDSGWLFLRNPVSRAGNYVVFHIRRETTQALHPLVARAPSVGAAESKNW